MIASMAQTQNFPQHRKFFGIPPGGSSHKTSLTTHSSSSFVNSLGGQEFRNHEVPPLAKSSPRWQSDPHISTRWPNNSNESSGHGCPVSDSISEASSELFGNTIGSKDWEQQVQHMDSNLDRYTASLASMLPGGSPGLGRSMASNGISSSPLVGGLLSSATRLGQGWDATVDHGNLGLTVDPSKGGFALQGVGHAASLSLPRFSTNPGFVERAARYSAFGNGQYSPSFPLTENGNVGRALSPSFENESKRVKASTGSPRSEFLSATCSAEVSGRNSVPHGNTLDGIVAERVREDLNGKSEAKASVSRLFVGSSGSPDEQDEGDQEQNADDRERVTSESDASDVSRGQETSCADQAMVDLGRTASGTKRKSFSSDDAMKETSSRTCKEQKGSGGHSKRFKRVEGAGDKEEQKSKAERSGSENSGISNSPAAKESSKPAEQPKMDYIHVRARRGQATDSHSLAERVRREKISERMKFLQDLVPGCSKVTGKAVMLDEIINYVQSIQRQVEFLSMKLAAVTPRPEFNVDNFFNKQKSQFCARPGIQLQAGNGNGYGLPNVVEPRVDQPDSSLPFPRIQSNQQVHLQHGVARSLEFQQAVDASLRNMSSSSPLRLPRAPIESFGDGLPQVASLWDGDLLSVVQMGFGQTSQGDLPPGHMKMEL